MYRIQAAFIRDSITIKQIDRREAVRVGNSEETTRAGEAILFQEVVAVPPGRYVVRLQANDINSSRGFSAQDTVDAPSFPAHKSMSEAIIISQGTGRLSVDARPDFVVNARNTVGAGVLGPRVYIERYGSDDTTAIPLRLVNDTGKVLWTADARMHRGDRDLRVSIVDMPSGVLAVGRNWLEVGADAKSRVPVIVNVTDQWLVTDFEMVLEFVRYVAYTSELDSLRRATEANRDELWERFWARRDPAPDVPGNEFRDQFFERVNIALREFSESARPGWKSDRGQAFIVLGPPSYAQERYVGRGISAQPNLIEWFYQDINIGPLTLQFFDRNGFGNYELTQASRAAFLAAAHRLRPR